MRILRVSPIIRVRGTRRVFSGEEGILVMLRRFRISRELVPFKRNIQSNLKCFIRVAQRHVGPCYPFAQRALRLEVWPGEFPRLALELSSTGCLIPTCCGFIDGSLFKIRRPTEGEDAAYNGWKRMHATKYQAVVLSNFMIADYDGPHPGSTGDSNILRRSNIVDRLEDINAHLGR